MVNMQPFSLSLLPAIGNPRSVDETAYTLDTYPGHSLDTCNISIDFPTHFRSIFDYFDILWFIFDFSTYEQYHMLIAQPLRPITNRITACFTFIPSFLPSAYHITGD